eukprot:1002381-Amorphochlora_amoeboformis.AAC.2
MSESYWHDASTGVFQPARAASYEEAVILSGAWTDSDRCEMCVSAIRINVPSALHIGTLILES